MATVYVVELSEEERSTLRALISGGKCSARVIKRAQILLAADAGRSDAEIVATLQVGVSTVYRTRRRFVEERMFIASRYFVTVRRAI